MSGEGAPAEVVVVDDEADLREAVAGYLARQGLSVRAAGNAAELRALLAERQADAVILDIAMPGEDGLSVARGLRAQGDMGIVMLTASADVVDRIVGLEVGADDYIAKPFDLRELLARLRAVLRLRPEAGGPQAGGTVIARGRLEAEVTQTCVVTLEPVEQRVAEEIALRLLPPGREAQDGPEEMDEIEAAPDGTVDLGEAVAEQLSLALDPYPRAPGAVLPELGEGDGDGAAAPAEEKPNPFAALAALRRDR